MTGILSSPQTRRIVITDILVLAAVYFIPALAHLSQYKIYYLDPMRFFLFAGFLISRNNINAFILAATIPLFSSLVVGHPVFFKGILIGIELLVNIGLFIYMLNKVKWHPGIIIFTATILSKCVYYTCKYIFIQAGLIKQELIATELLTQLITVTALSLVFAIFYKRKKQE